MNEKKNRPVTTLPEKHSPEISQDQLEEIQFPELSKDQFKIGDRAFRIRALPWKWERVFRKACMPILESELKPFERAIYMFTSDLAIVKEDLGFTRSFTESETDVDAHLTHCVNIMCMSQDAKIMELAAKGQEVPLELQLQLEAGYRILIDNCEEWPEGGARNCLREIVRKQCEKMKLVQTLGESLIARLEELSALTGMKSQFDSLKRDLSKQASEFMAKAGKIAGIPDKSSSQSTGSGSAKKQVETPSKPLSLNPEPETRKEESQKLAEKASA